MLKKTFYTVLALGAMIIIGSAASGFMSANTATKTIPETTIETGTPFAGTWIAGKVSIDGTKEAGTGSWTVKKLGGNKYRIDPSSGKIVSIVVTPHYPENNNLPSIIHDEDYRGEDYVYVLFTDPTDYLTSYTTGNEMPFSFVAYVEE